MAATFDRRAFLVRSGLAGAGAVALAGSNRPAAHADEALAPFLHGVASGDPLHRPGDPVDAGVPAGRRGQRRGDLDDRA